MGNCLAWIVNYFAGSSISPHTNDPDDYQEPIHKFHYPSNPNVVIIFFHDILWDGEDQQLHKSTWMSSNKPPVSWPETWLSTKYREAQILSAHYDAAIRKGKRTGHMDLYRLCENLWQDILPLYTTDIPVFLVGHGFGGLVIKALILEMQVKHDALARSKSSSTESRNDKDLCILERFLKNVKGILYYSSPFLGSKLADSLKNSPSTSSLLGILTVLSSETSRYNDRFTNWRKCHPECTTRALLEGLPTKVGSWSGHLVEEGSVRLDADHVYTVDSNHFDVCKPQSEKDIRFTWLIDLIDPIMSTVNPGPAVPVEDSAKSACPEIVEKILKQIQDCKGQERPILSLKIDELTKLSRFKELSDRVQVSLDEAGLKKTFSNGYIELYE